MIGLCFSEKQKKVGLTLTISNITKEMLNWTYECVVTKVDVLSAYYNSLSRYKLHSADPLDHQPRNVVVKRNTENLANLTYFYNSTKDICTLDKPCTAKLIFHLMPPHGKLT